MLLETHRLTLLSTPRCRLSNEQARSLVQTTQHISSRVTATRTLFRERCNLLAPIEIQHIESILQDNEAALRETARVIEPARVDMATRKDGKLGLKTRTMFRFRDGSHVMAHMQRLAVIKTSLDACWSSLLLLRPLSESSTHTNLSIDRVSKDQVRELPPCGDELVYGRKVDYEEGNWKIYSSTTNDIPAIPELAATERHVEQEGLLRSRAFVLTIPSTYSPSIQASTTGSFTSPLELSTSSSPTRSSAQPLTLASTRSSVISQTTFPSSESPISNNGQSAPPLPLTPSSRPSPLRPPPPKPISTFPPARANSTPIKIPPIPPPKPPSLLPLNPKPLNKSQNEQKQIIKPQLRQGELSDELFLPTDTKVKDYFSPSGEQENNPSCTGNSESKDVLKISIVKGKDSNSRFHDMNNGSCTNMTGMGMDVDSKERMWAWMEHHASGGGG